MKPFPSSGGEKYNKLGNQYFDLNYGFKLITELFIWNYCFKFPKNFPNMYWIKKIKKKTSDTKHACLPERIWMCFVGPGINLSDAILLSFHPFY